MMTTTTPMTTTTLMAMTGDATNGFYGFYGYERLLKQWGGGRMWGGGWLGAISTAGGRFE